MYRKQELVQGETYHIFNRSIADFRIFSSDQDFFRMKDTLRYYQRENMPYKFSQFIKSENIKNHGFLKYLAIISQNRESIVQIIAYCFMPTHIHLIINQLKDNGISNFMGNILNSYSHYFNTKYKRKGPLWEGRFKNVLIENDEQLLHLTRYVHLNPVTGYLVGAAEEWKASSYLEYLQKASEDTKVCQYRNLLEIDTTIYKNFVEDRISYQRELAKIKKLLCEEPVPVFPLQERNFKDRSRSESR